MANMRDRIDAVGGSLDIETPATGGTCVRVRVPVMPFTAVTAVDVGA
jgi:signal transduction histidine kinase